MKKIVVIGRGGVGKSCFVAAVARILKAHGPILLIDADPDQSLAEMVGLDMAKEGVKTIADLLFDIKGGQIEDKLKSASLIQKVDYLLSRHGLYEGKDFDFFSLGTKWTEGCYCQPNNILKALVGKLEKNYRFVLIDSPAGLEHLNRRVTSSVDDIFAIIGGSKKAFDNALRAKKIIEEIKIEYRHFYMIAGYDFPSDHSAGLEKDKSFICAGHIARDDAVARLCMAGESIFALPEDSSFLKSIREILSNAGLTL